MLIDGIEYIALSQYPITGCGRNTERIQNSLNRNLLFMSRVGRASTLIVAQRDPVTSLYVSSFFFGATTYISIAGHVSAASPPRSSVEDPLVDNHGGCPLTLPITHPPPQLLGSLEPSNLLIVLRHVEIKSASDACPERTPLICQDQPPRTRHNITTARVYTTGRNSYTATNQVA
jgi:hypothetical protein